MAQKWWHGKVAYQIYPKSFCDSNGDGIGDIPGIISKLDYLKSLGVDLIWISPFYRSPMADQGYDISDYYDIDPIFGTMADFDRLLAEAKKRDMNLILDLVVNHCSDEHEWFKKACEDPDGPYGKYFYIYDHKDGEPYPSNIRNYFGGGCWDPLPGHPDKVYYHLFHKKQPDLNWENPTLREEIYKMINWWLDKGIAGFRIDAIMNIKKPLPLVHYPADRADGLCDPQVMLDHAVGLGDFLTDIAAHTFRPHDAFTVGEVFGDKPEEFEKYIGENGYFSTKFDFAPIGIGTSVKGWYAYKDVRPDQLKKVWFESQEIAEGRGYMATTLENHDEPRSVCRYIKAEDRSVEAKKMLGGLFYFLKGIPFIYEGQEIGMENADITDISEVDDINTKGEYQVALDAGFKPEKALKLIMKRSRENARTPMQWSSDAQAGFTTGKPWSKLNANYTCINAAAQEDDPKSVLNFYRQMGALRKNSEYFETFAEGKVVPYLAKKHNFVGYFRTGEKNVLVMGNYQKRGRKVKLPGEVKNVLLNNMDTCVMKNGKITLAGYQFVILELK